MRVPWWLPLVAGCATGEALRIDAEAIQQQLDLARKAGAYRCAPKALAEGEAQLDFLLVELRQGNAVRAAEHRALAKERAQAAIEGSEGCAVRDKDGDGVLDGEDQCPDEPGPAALGGCPDKDGDGIPDHLDGCPDQPEDLDGFEDEDGCPDPDNDGDGLLDGEDRCPDQAGPRENQGCPAGDRDADGIPDHLDRCPDEPEDFDGFEDEDGCPDPDNDGDGIPDHLDICPNEPETVNGFEDEDGCPDVKLDLVEVKRDQKKIEIKEKVFFDTGKSTIQPVSYRLLDQVAEVLSTYRSMEIMVEGHTDSVGADSFNLRLSQARADSVRLYLISRGVEQARLTAIGFGEEKPIATNATRQGRDLNRRVEFTITAD